MEKGQHAGSARNARRARELGRIEVNKADHQHDDVRKAVGDEEKEDEGVGRGGGGGGGRTCDDGVARKHRLPPSLPQPRTRPQ